MINQTNIFYSIYRCVFVCSSMLIDAVLSLFEVENVNDLKEVSEVRTNSNVKFR